MGRPFIVGSVAWRTADMIVKEKKEKRKRKLEHRAACCDYTTPGRDGGMGVGGQRGVGKEGNG